MILNLLLATRFLFSGNVGSFSSYAGKLATLGLSIGISCLIITASIIHGFEDVISKKLQSIEGAGRINHIFAETIDKNRLPVQIKSNINKAATPFVRGISMLRYKSNAEGIIIEGIELLPEFFLESNIQEIKSGQIILGDGLAKKMEVQVGSKVFIQGFDEYQSVFGIPKIIPLEVVGIYNSGFQDYDNSLVYVSIEEAQGIFKYEENEITGIIVNDYLSFNKSSVRYPYYFETWIEKHALLFDWLSIQKWPAYLMFGLIALVGLVNLIAALYMITIEKSSQIGILISQGMSIKNIKRVFIIQGFIIGFFGGILGGLFSFLIIVIQKKYNFLSIPSDVYFMNHVPFSYDYRVFILLIFTSATISFMVSWLSIKRITSFNPIEALRLG